MSGIRGDLIPVLTRVLRRVSREAQHTRRLKHSPLTIARLAAFLGGKLFDEDKTIMTREEALQENWTVEDHIKHTPDRPNNQEALFIALDRYTTILDICGEEMDGGVSLQPALDSAFEDLMKAHFNNYPGYNFFVQLHEDVYRRHKDYQSGPDSSSGDQSKSSSR
jgi:hypothetical protein